MRSIALALLWVAHATSAQGPAPLPAPNLDLFARGFVYALARTADGGVVIGGQFSSVFDPATQLNFQRDNLARFSASGALDLAWDPAASGAVYALAVAPDGSVFAGGEFNFIDGQVHRALVKLSGTGSGAVIAGWNAPVNGFVQSLALDVAGGTLYAGGQFAITGAPAITNAAKFSIADGSVNFAWAPAPDGRVRALLVEGGALYAGGEFAQIGGLARNRIARLSTTGTGAADPVWNPAPNFVVLAFAPVTGGGAIHAGGQFTTIGGQTRTGLARLSTSGTGAADPLWNPVLWTGTVVQALSLDAAGNVVAAGYFAEAGGLPRSNIARFASTGTGAVDAAWDPALDTEVYALATTAGGGVLAGGAFSRVDGQVALGFARLSTNGSLEPTPLIQAVGGIWAIARAPDGSTYLGGNFARANEFARANLLRLTPSGQIDASWDPGASDEVLALARGPDGSIYVGGIFARAGGLARSQIAKLSGGGTGGADPDWDASAAGGVAALAVGGGSLYVGGSFALMGGVLRSRLAKVALDGTGALDLAWNPGANEYVRALLLDTDGTLYAGGRFTVVGGQAHVGLARMSASGTGAVDAAWVPSTNSDVLALAKDLPSSLVVGGFFTQVNGAARGGIARVSTSGAGALEAAWNPGNLAAVWSLATAADGFVYATGFNDATGLTEVLRVSSSGTGPIDASFRPAVVGTVFALALEPGGKLFAGGNFSAIGGQFRRLVAALPTRADFVFGNGFE